VKTKDWIRFWGLGLIWGTSFLWIKIAVSEVTPFVLVGLRTLLGALGLLAVIFISRTMRLRWAEIRPWLGIFAVIGLFNVALPFVLISWSEQFISSGIASILNSTTPLFTIILAPLFLSDDRFTRAKFTGLVVGFAGVLVLFLQELAVGWNANLLALGVMLLATFSYAGASVYARRKAQALPAAVQAFLQLSFATLFVWGYTIPVQRSIHLPHLSITWLALVWLGLLGSCVAYILYFQLLQSIGPTRTTMVTYTMPLVGVLLGALFLHEQLSWQVVVGGLLILSGIAVVNSRGIPLLRRLGQRQAS
jgi:drug/metabolite transporter (DMT)-like permease